MAVCATCEREYLDSYPECPFCARDAAREATEAEEASHPAPVGDHDARPRSWAPSAALLAGLASVVGIVVYLVIQVVFVGQATDIADVADREACFYSQVNVERAAMVYKEENGDQASSLEVLLDGYVQAPPSCGSGGSYLWDPRTGRLSCTIHGWHTLER